MHTHTHTPLLPVKGQTAAPPPEGAPGICESTPITAPQLEVMNQLVTLSFYSARITRSPHSSNLGASVRDRAEGALIDTTREFAGLGYLLVVGVSREREIIYCCSLFLEEIMGDIHILHSEQLYEGSCLNKLQHADTLYKTYWRSFKLSTCNL